MAKKIKVVIDVTFFKNVAIPMRAQPFHLGHEYYLRKISQICRRGIIFLNQKFDNADNPFPLILRAKWVNNFLTNNDIRNIYIANRESISASKKYTEYQSFFSDEKFTVFTTDENDMYYKKHHFLYTYNMHDLTPKLIFWHDMPNKFSICSNGRIIRKKIFLKQDIFDLVSNEVYKDITDFYNQLY